MRQNLVRFGTAFPETFSVRQKPPQSIIVTASPIKELIKKSNIGSKSLSS